MTAVGLLMDSDSIDSIIDRIKTGKHGRDCVKQDEFDTLRKMVEANQNALSISLRKYDGLDLKVSMIEKKVCELEVSIVSLALAVEIRLGGCV